MWRPSQGSSRCNGDFGDFSVESGFCWKLVGSGGVAIHVAKIRHFHVDILMSRALWGGTEPTESLQHFGVGSVRFLVETRIWWSCSPMHFHVNLPHVEAVAEMEHDQQQAG